MLGARAWLPGVVVSNLGGRPSAVDGFPELRPLALLRDAGFEVHAVSRGTPREKNEVDGVTTWVETDIGRVAARIALLRPELLLVEAITYGAVLGPIAHRSWIRNPMPAASAHMRRLQRVALHSFDAVSFTNPAQKREWRFSDERHVDLPYPVDVQWWSTPVPRRDSWWTHRGWPVPQGPVLVSTAAYARGKRVCELLEWVAPFLAENRSAVVVFVGHPSREPDVTEHLRTRPDALAVAEQVRVTGWLGHNELRDLMSWASVSIINSVRETQCLAIYEALASGVPTLISAIPMLTSQFPNLPAHRDERELRVNLESVLGDPALGASLIESSRERLVWADVRRHDEVFQDALARLLGRHLTAVPSRRF